MGGPGFIYLAKFNLFDGCYKIGSTSDPVKRKSHLQSLYGSTDFVAFGEVPDKLEYERKIQRMLYRCSHRSIIAENPEICNSIKDLVDAMPVGNFRSTEHFKFGDVEAKCATALIRSMCSNTGSLHGTENKLP